MLTRYSRCIGSIRLSRKTSAYSPSVGRNITANSVVYGGLMYFFAMSAANSFILPFSTACAAFTASALPCSYASIKFVYASAGNFESMGSSTVPSSAGSFIANSTRSLVACFTFAFTSYCSGAIISPSIAPS